MAKEAISLNDRIYDENVIGPVVVTSRCRTGCHSGHRGRLKCGSSNRITLPCDSVFTSVLLQPTAISSIANMLLTVKKSKVDDFMTFAASLAGDT